MCEDFKFSDATFTVGFQLNNENHEARAAVPHTSKTLGQVRQKNGKYRIEAYFPSGNFDVTHFSITGENGLYLTVHTPTAKSAVGFILAATDELTAPKIKEAVTGFYKANTRGEFKTTLKAATHATVLLDAPTYEINFKVHLAARGKTLLVSAIAVTMETEVGDKWWSWYMGYLKQMRFMKGKD